MITSVYIDTDELVFQLHSVSDDAQKALEWVRSFRDTLMFGARIPNPLPFAMECMAMSEGFSASGVLGKLRASARKRLNDEGVDPTAEAVDAEIARTQGADTVREIMAKIDRANSLKAEIRRRKFTAAAATREGVDVVHDRESGSFARTTGCNHSQVAPTSNAGDESSYTGNGAALKSATACNSLTADGDIREDSLNIRDTGDRGILESGTSANHYDQEAAPTSTDGPRQAEARQGQRAGENSLRVAKVSTSPVRSSGPAKRPHGEFGNVMLTDEEFAKLCEKCADADSLITELDQYIESQGKTKKYKSHYATLLNWSRRKSQESKPKQEFKTAAEKQRDELQKIADYYASKEVVG